MNEWDAYSITFPKKKGLSLRSGRSLDTVYHVAHVSEARRILEDGRLKAGLVYDESRLNRSRLCVSWLSANTWAAGSIYGNVQFAFRWSELIDGRRFYWVEAMPNYSPAAYRILLTDRDLSNSRYVTPYDPAVDRGPLRERAGVWFWNGDCTSEFMIEGDIDLADCLEVDFISHHPDICRLSRKTCSDLKATAHRTGGRLLAFILGNRVHAIDHVLGRSSPSDAARALSHAVDVGANGILRALGSKCEFRGPIRTATSRAAVLRGALALYGGDQKSKARELVALLRSRDVFEQALTELINEHFGIADWVLPD